MVLGHLDDFAIGENALELARDVFPLERPVKVVERRRTAAKQELAEQRHLGVEQGQVAALNEINPRMLEEFRVFERQDDRILDVDGRRGLDPSRQILLGRRRVDIPRLAVVLGRLGLKVIADPHEPPLQAGVAVV